MRRDKMTGLVAAALVGVIVPSSPAASQPGPPRSPQEQANLCGQLVSAIVHAEQNLSMIAADDVGDDSAPRATMRAGQQSFEMQRIAVNLGQMRELRCAPYPYAISQGAYLVAAVACRSALKRQAAPGGRPADPEACDRDSWARNPAN